jgi:hypothetical protein
MVRKWRTVVFWEWEKKSVEQWCFSIGGKRSTVLSNGGRGKAKQLLDGVVSSVKNGEEMKKVV